MKQKTRRRKSAAAISFARLAPARASAVTAAAPLAHRRAADTENNDEKRKARYKETDHVKTFYRVNRYPS